MRVQGDRDAQIRRSREWESRPGLSRAVRVIVVAGPVAASFGVATLLSRMLPRADGAAATLLSVTVIAAASLGTLIGFERAARRLLPLAALLNLSLIFPDKAPARFAVARRSGKPKDLQESLRQAQAGGHEDDARWMRTIIELVLALSVHDKASRGHSERVRVFTDLLADELKVPAAGRSRLRWAALLHDIGKLEVAPAILNKPGRPSEEEWAVLHRHPEAGARLVAPLLPWLGEWGHAVEQHHERFDGTGYPHRLHGSEISLAARIVSVADAYEVMTAPRPYKKSMSVAAARRELVRVAGTQLDPEIVRAFLNVSVGRLWRTIGVGAWIAQVPQLGRVFSLGGWAGSGLGTGIATAATATVFATAGLIGPGPLAPVPSPSGLARAVAVIPPPAPPTLPAQASGVPRSSAPRATPSSTAAGRSTPAPPAAAATAPPQATSAPLASSRTPAPSTRPTATPIPAPAASPDPWSCALCTNTAPACTSFCNSGNSLLCVTFCLGGNNHVCTAHCFGGNNTACLSYCQGGNNTVCQSFCRNSVVQASLTTAAVSLVVVQRSGRRELRSPDSTLTATISTTNAIVIRPLY